ncbi:unnamed protein product [Cylicocyclus nassatus]|uniref:Lysozyme n=1 Tax=Cylicocyclus nassatus TaxID=53992 RepID=A0AA36MFI2_CYLNA|nr:unnamed protein product [Cylicocyclus nassatus]
MIDATGDKCADCHSLWPMDRMIELTAAAENEENQQKHFACFLFFPVLAMSIILVLPALFGVCFAKSVNTKPIVTSSSTYAYAVDLDKPVPKAAFTCMKNKGISTAIIRAYGPSNGGNLDENAVNNIRNADQAGLGTEVFMTPVPQSKSNKTGSQQFRELFEGLKAGNITIRAMWLQVVSPKDWGSKVDNNIYLLNDIISMAKYYGVRVGIYSSAYDWKQITKNAIVENAMLWYWKVNGGGAKGETPANFNDFVPFGKFTKATMKQYGQTEELCGVTLNKDVYEVKKAKLLKLTDLKGKKDDELIAGRIGSDLFGAVAVPAA